MKVELNKQFIPKVKVGDIIVLKGDGLRLITAFGCEFNAIDLNDCSNGATANSIEELIELYSDASFGIQRIIPGENLKLVEV